MTLLHPGGHLFNSFFEFGAAPFENHIVEPVWSLFPRFNEHPVTALHNVARLVTVSGNLRIVHCVLKHFLVWACQLVEIVCCSWALRFYHFQAFVISCPCVSFSKHPSGFVLKCSTTTVDMCSRIVNDVFEAFPTVCCESLVKFDDSFLTVTE